MRGGYDFSDAAIKKRREANEKLVADSKAKVLADNISRVKEEVDILFDRGKQAKEHPFDFDGYDEVHADWLAEWSDRRDEYVQRQSELRRFGYHGLEATRAFLYPRKNDVVPPDDYVPPNGDWRQALKDAKREARENQPDALRAKDLLEQNKQLVADNRSMVNTRELEDERQRVAAAPRTASELMRERMYGTGHVGDYRLNTFSGTKTRQ